MVTAAFVLGIIGTVFGVGSAAFIIIAVINS